MRNIKISVARISSLILLITAALAYHACDPIEFKNPVVALQVPATELRADGYTVIPITVGLTVDDAKDDLKVVKLETLAGQFNTATGLKNETTVTVKPGESTIVNLIAGFKPGDFEVKASINTRPEFVTRQTLTLSPLLPNDVITKITLDPVTLAADGKTIVNGTIQLSNTDKRLVSIESTDKTTVFTGSTNNIAQATANSNGLVNFSFKPGLTPGAYSIVVKLLNDDRNLQAIAPILLTPLFPEDIFATITLDPDSVLADGRSMINGTVQLANTDKRQVTIESTDRTSVFTGDTDNTVQLTANSNGLVNFSFKPGIVAGIYSVVVKLVGDERNLSASKNFLLRQLQPEDLIALTLSNDMNVKANGTSLIHGVVQLKNTDKRAITVEVTDPAAIILGTTTNTATLTSDVNGKAEFDVKVSPNAGTYFIKVRLNDDNRGLVAQRSYSTRSLASSEILGLVLPSAAVFADGTSIVTGTVTAQNTALNVITVIISQGEFLDASGQKQKDVLLDPSGSKTFSFKTSNTVPDGNDTTSYIVEAKLKGTNYSVQKFLRVYTARPNAFTIEPSAYTFTAAAANLTIKALMTRSGGKVSDGVPVTFEATQTVGGIESPVGRFTNGGVAYSREQVATTTFTTTDRTPVVGTAVVIKVTTLLENGTLTTQTIQLTPM